MTEKINIKNYTSEVPANVSINKIEEMIVKHGARQVQKVYNKAGKMEGIKFVLLVDNMMLTFDMDAKVDLVYNKMISNYVYSTTATQRAACMKQAERTAWKNVCELLQLQLDMVYLNQVDLMQALFLSLSDGTETVYEKMKKTNFKALLPANV
jgi:hypothetical protein